MNLNGTVNFQLVLCFNFTFSFMYHWTSFDHFFFSFSILDNFFLLLRCFFKFIVVTWSTFSLNSPASLLLFFNFLLVLFLFCLLLILSCSFVNLNFIMSLL